MPKLWNATIASHRVAVQDAILETAWNLAQEHGPLSVTMTQVADGVDISRATLYKYFPDVESILRAHHDRRMEQHLHELAGYAAGPRTAEERLGALMAHYAQIAHHRARHGSTDLSALLHRGQDVAGAEERLRNLFADVLDEAAADGVVRGDVPAIEMANFCLHALEAAAKASDEAGVARLRDLTLQAVRAPRR